MQYNIVLNGPKEYLPKLSKYNYSNVLWVGADKGAVRILTNRLRLYAAMGDFDSVTSYQKKVIEKKAKYFNCFSTKKDETDFEIILNWICAKNNVDKIRVFGWSGGRFDQFISNVSVVAKKKYEKIADRVEFIDRQNWVKLLVPGNWKIHPIRGMNYVSFYSFAPVEDLAIRNFKYELSQDQLDSNVALSSNEFMPDQLGIISFTKGLMLVSQSTDIV